MDIETLFPGKELDEYISTNIFLEPASIHPFSTDLIYAFKLVDHFIQFGYWFSLHCYKGVYYSCISKKDGYQSHYVTQKFESPAHAICVAAVIAHKALLAELQTEKFEAMRDDGQLDSSEE